MPKIGPFFYIRGKLIFHCCPLSEGRRQADKLDDSLGHDQLYEKHFKTGDYIDYPRGRVIWDTTNQRAIVYIDPCINKASILKQISAAFALEQFTVESDDHYHCKNCVGNLFD